MTNAVIQNTNSTESIRDRYSSARLSWWPVLLFLPARLVFALVAQAIAAGFFAVEGSDNAWMDAAAIWPVYSTVTDVFCLLSMAWLTRRENLGITDLFGISGKSVWKELAWTPAYLLAVAPGALLANIITQAYYGTALPPMISIVNLSPIGSLYTLIVWPIIWVITEELVYLGYLLPRMEVFSGNRWIAVVVVTFFWGLQHFAIPFLPDTTYLVSRVLAAAAAVSAVSLVFVLWRRRLLPLIGAHYVADLSTAILVGLLPLLNRG